MAVVRYIPFLLVCAAVLADTESNVSTNGAEASGGGVKNPEFALLLTQLEQIVSSMGDKFDKQLKGIDSKLNQLNSRIGAVDSALKKIQEGPRKESNANVTQCNSVATPAVLPLQSQPPQQAQNELQRLASLIATLATSSQKWIEQLECKIYEQFRASAEHSKRGLLDVLYAPTHACQRDWTVFQRRLDGSVNFLRTWTEYQRGFGNPEGEFWLGLDKLSAMLATGRHELLVQLEAFSGTVAYALYDDFRLGNASEMYKLKSIGQYSGSAGDSLTYHEGQLFSTFDEDNDASVRTNCAKLYDGAWWYGICCKSNLNGKYQNGDSYNLMHWSAFQNTKGLKSSTMMIRPYPSRRETASKSEENS